jgi:putative ABC transport system permease protein
MMKEFLTRMRFLFSPPRQGELDEELQFHLEQATESYIAAGMTPEEARRQARVLFGGVEAARENCHEEQPGWWLGTVAQDVRYALRGFHRAPVFAVKAHTLPCPVQHGRKSGYAPVGMTLLQLEQR